MDPQAQQVIDLIIKQGTKLEEIYNQTVRAGADPGMGFERYKRWKEATEKLINEQIGQNEVKRFKSIRAPKGVMWGPFRQLDFEVAKLKNYLVVLAEGIMDGSVELNPVALQSKRYYVLRKLYELAPNDKHGDVLVSKLAQELRMDYQEANRILLYWEDKHMVHSPSDESVALTPFAIDEIESTLIHPDRSTEHFPTQVINYYLTVHGDNYGGIQQGNQGSNQTSTTNINSQFENAIKHLLSQVEQSESLSKIQKISIKADIQTVSALADLEKSPEVIQEANTKIGAIQSVLSNTADLVSLGTVIIPIIRSAFGG